MEVRKKIHEVLHLVIINQWLGPRELAKNIFLFQMKEIMQWKKRLLTALTEDNIHYMEDQKSDIFSFICYYPGKKLPYMSRHVHKYVHIQVWLYIISFIAVAKKNLIKANWSKNSLKEWYNMVRIS